MGRFAGFDEVYAALYVDFDNIYARFLETDPEAARAFACMPNRWIKWLEIHALRMLYGDGVRRRILKRICYINSYQYQEFHANFIRAAFRVTDCSCLVRQNKTNSDIRLVTDCMDDVFHSSKFDEFIILSGDTDFTPLLTRLHEHAKRTLVLSVGHSALANTAVASWRIREDWFVKQALLEKSDDESFEVQDIDS